MNMDVHVTRVDWELLGRSRDFRDHKDFKKFQIIVGNEFLFSERSHLGLGGLSVCWRGPQQYTGSIFGGVLDCP